MPIIIGALILCALVAVALIRIHRAPGLGLVELFPFDEEIRGALARVVTLFGIAAVALSIGIVLWGAGSTISALSRFPTIGDCHTVGAQAQMCHGLGPTFSQPTFAGTTDWRADPKVPGVQPRQRSRGERRGCSSRAIGPKSATDVIDVIGDTVNE